MADPLLNEFSQDHSLYKDIEAASQPTYNMAIGIAHPSLVQLLEILLPARGGLSFLEAFLHQATVESAGEAAVVRARNQRELARLLGLDYDRTNKYVLVLQQMRVLQRCEERPGIALYLPLGEPHLARPDTLDALTSYRPKVASFARQVKQRWLALLATRDACILSCTSQFAQTTQADKAFSTSHKGFVDLEDVRQAIFDLFDPVAAHRLIHEIESLASQRSTPATTGDATPKGDSPSEMATTNGDLATHIGDSPSLRYEQTKGDSPAQIGDSSPQKATQTGDSVARNGDCPATESPEKRRLVTPKMGDSRATSAHTMGDSSPSDMATHLSNVNVTLLNLINNVNVNVREIASDLCQIFGETSQQQGYYIQLARQHSNPQAWLGALLETLLAHHRGSVQKPGGYFYKRCVALHKALPAETERLIIQFGTYTYAQLQEHLRSSGTTSQATSQAASPSQQPATQARATSTEPEVALLIPREKQHPGMPEETLVKIQHHIEENMMSYRLHAIPYRQQDGTYSLLLADYVKHQRWIYSLEEWQETYARLCQSGRLRDIFNIPAA